MTKRTKRLLAGTLTAAVVAAVSVTAASSRPTASALGPIKIGISLSLSGDFSDPGKAVKRGYDLWAAYVNAHGGILGRKVQLKIVNDASDPNQAVSNYQKLITGDHVDLAFGPFSSLLTGPSATVANRYHYAFLEPAGGGPKVFALKLHNLFFVQPAPVVKCGDSFVRYLKTLPASQRPKTASYASLDDPFSSPIADAMQHQLSGTLHVKTVYKTIYPAETTDLTPIVAKEIAPKPDMIIGGTQSEDAYSQVKGLVQAGYNPKFLFFANGANSPTEFPNKVGRKNVNGIFSCSDWTPVAKTSGNELFVSQYVKRYGGTGFDIDNNSAEAWAVGQLLQVVAAKIGSIDNQKIIAALHKGVWPTIEGSLSWDANGSPNGDDLLVEWIKGKLLPVFPPGVAVAKPFSPKPVWGK
ncbi:MAG: amino acid ABC transporter substrate-binding protein [Actinomycetota bacterium]|nr:amino acid ABC transporter substrate-binding protein [Actinomycetota bacterium]